MARRFAGGLTCGIVLVAGGLAVLSQLAPLPEPAGKSAAGTTGAAGADAATRERATAQAATTETATTETATPETATDETATNETATNETVIAGSEAAAPLASATNPPAKEPDGGVAQTGGNSSLPDKQKPIEAARSDKVAGSATGPTASLIEAVRQPAEPVVPGVMALGGGLPDLPDLPDAAGTVPALADLDAALASPVQDPAPTAPQAPAPGPGWAGDLLLVPSHAAGLTEPSRLPQIATPQDPGLVPLALPMLLTPFPGDGQPKAAAPLVPRLITPESSTLPFVKGLQSTLPTTLEPSVPGVDTNAVPQIGDLPVTGSGQSPTDIQPFVKYARNFEGAGGKPLFAILLHDVGGSGMNRADLANLPFPVTFVIDPLAPDAKEAEATYRAAGQEVLMLANGIPAGATAGDVAQIFHTLADILPQAVGVIDMGTLGFQDNRALAALVLPVIADQGRGLVTYDVGLNAADQIARRDGLPAAVVFRTLDAAAESQPTIRRYLDRAAFKAAQEGSVVVMGNTTADTVATILQWAMEGKGATVALAPVTAVMGVK